MGRINYIFYLIMKRIVKDLAQMFFSIGKFADLKLEWCKILFVLFIRILKIIEFFTFLEKPKN